MKYLVVDCETGGLDPKKNALLEVAAIICDSSGGVAVVGNFNKKIQWDHAMPTTVHLGALGVNRSDMKGEAPGAVAREMATFFAAAGGDKGLILMGQNLQFDTDFISEFMARYGFVGIFDAFRHRKIDTIQIANFLIDNGMLPPTLDPSLKNLHQHFFGTNIQGAHTSLGDCKATFAVYREMCRLLREGVSWDSTQAISRKGRQ